jgi:phosphatidylserine/phosphatidylglycerophosphate/cardiolipin synthase-like enzyme
VSSVADIDGLRPTMASSSTEMGVDREARIALIRAGVFVTSANLTEAALDRNIEVGLLVRDRALALSLSAHFRGLIDRKLLAPLPGE